MVDENKYMPIGKNYEKNDKVDPKVFYIAARLCAIFETIGAPATQRVLNDYAALCADKAEAAELKALRETGEGFA